MIYQIGNFFGIRKLRDTAESGIMVHGNRFAAKSASCCIKYRTGHKQSLCPVLPYRGIYL